MKVSSLPSTANRENAEMLLRNEVAEIREFFGEGRLRSVKTGSAVCIHYLICGTGNVPLTVPVPISLPSHKRLNIRNCSYSWEG